jgi:site-specific DNA recombinase
MPNTNGHGPKKAILYARVSTDEQARSGYSLAQQLEALREYAAREGYEVIEEVSDPGQRGVGAASSARLAKARSWREGASSTASS